MENEVKELLDSVVEDIEAGRVVPSVHTVDEAFDVIVIAIRLINGEFV